MSLEYGTFKLGGVTYPLTSSLTNETLKDADPSLYYILSYFSAVLTLQLNARYAAIASAVSMPHQNGIVSCVAPYDVSRYLTESGYTFPLLAIWPKSSVWENRTVQKRHRIRTLNVAWVLPPLGIQQVESMLPFLPAIGAVLDASTERGYDPNVNGGEKFWQESGLESIEIVSESLGAWEAADGLTFNSVVFELIVKERTMAVTGAFGALAGIDGHVDYKDANGTTVQDVAQIKAIG